MKNSELKCLIKNAYDVKPSRKKNVFIGKYRKRELNYGKMLLIQFRYMGPQMTVAIGLALAILIVSVADRNKDFANIFAAFMPAAALIALTGLGKSEKYKMSEIEAASRFSLRMVEILRLTVIGIAGAVIVLAASWAIKLLTGSELPRSFALAGTPYLITTFLCMLIIRKWHSEKNIYGCIAAAAVVCLLVLGGMTMLESCPEEICRWIILILFEISFVLTVCEANKYVIESEEIQWNLC